MYHQFDYKKNKSIALDSKAGNMIQKDINRTYSNQSEMNLGILINQ